MDTLQLQSSVRPLDAGLVDLLSDTSASGYATESELPDGTTVKLTARTLHVVAGLNGLAHDKTLPVLHQAMETARLQSVPDSPQRQDAINAGLHKLLSIANGLLTGGRIDESAKDVRFDFGGHVGSLTNFEVALGGDAPQDMLSATMALAVDGLVIDDLPPALAVYLPSHISIRPTVSNLSVRDLTAMAMDATAPGHDKSSPPDGHALFTHGGVNVGFDTLALDIAGTLASAARASSRSPGRRRSLARRKSQRTAWTR